MRITRVSIGSYGGIKDRTIVLGPRMNVFFGPNESGKTTTMEFIRNTILPSRKRIVYPERSKTDSGSITVESDGIEITMGFGAKDNPIPDALKSLDPEVYRNIFALNQKGLDEMETISSGDIRSRFLTIPGGERIPEASDLIDESIKSILGATSRSPSGVNDIQSKEDLINHRIAELREKTEEYSQLTNKKKELEEELTSINEANKEVSENNDLYSKVESVRPMFKSLADYRKRRAELSSGPSVSDEDSKRFEELQRDYNQKKYALQKNEEAIGIQMSKLPCDDDVLRGKKGLIKDLIYRLPEYKEQQPQPQVKKNIGTRRDILPSAVLAIIAAAIIVIPFADIMIRLPAGAILLAAGVLMFIRGNRVGGRKLNDKPDKRARFLEDLNLILRFLSMEPTSPFNDVDRLRGILDELDILDSLRSSNSELKMDCITSENEYIKFLSRFGGEEGFRSAKDKSSALKGVDSSILALTNSIKASGFDPNLPLPEVNWIQTDDSRKNELNREIGSIKAEMKTCLDTAELDRLMDESFSLRAMKADLLRDGAVSMIASHIMDDACSELYQDMHPGVMVTADRYLSLMTSGRYRIDTDPRNTDVSIISAEGVKGSKQWSTGLRAQVQLSLKLAIAKEMGEGKIPVILDDVLLPFDRLRKEGACKALVQVSEEMQVLLFTCDEAVRDNLSGNDGCNIIEMA